MTEITINHYEHLTKNDKTQLLLKEYLYALAGSQGCCVLHVHTDISFWEQLSEIVKLLPANVRHVYFESSDPTTESQDPNDKWGIQFPLPDKVVAIFNEKLQTSFFADPDVSMEDQTNFALVQNYGLGQLLNALNKTNMTLYFVDDPDRDRLSVEERNAYMSQCIKHLNKKLKPDEKYLVITGLGHHHLVKNLGCASIVHTSLIHFDEEVEKDMHFNDVVVTHEQPIITLGNNKFDLYPTSTIVPAISLFQPREREKLIAPEWVYTPDVINKIEHMQKLTGFGITLELGRQLDKDKLFKNKRPTIRLKVITHDNTNELVNQLVVFLEKNRSGETNKNILNKDVKIKAQPGLLEFIFRTNRAFKLYLDELYNFVVPKSESPDIAKSRPL